MSQEAVVTNDNALRKYFCGRTGYNHGKYQ
jgi:hypothetical protein